MMTSVEKTKTIVILLEPRRCKLIINNKIIEQAMEMEYQEIKVYSEGKVERQVRKQVNKAKKASESLNDKNEKNNLQRKQKLEYAETRVDWSKTLRLLGLLVGIKIAER